MSDLEISPDGYMVRRNGVVMRKPDWMSPDFWFKYEAPRCGTRVGKGGKFLYGASVDQPKWSDVVEEDSGDGCSSGACAI